MLRFSHTNPYKIIWTLTWLGLLFSRVKKLNKPFWSQVTAFWRATNHGKFVSRQTIITTANLPSYSASYTTRKICFLTRNHGHFPSQSYKIFIPDDAGFVPCCRKRAGRKHSAICKLQFCRNHTDLLRICIAHTWLVIIHVHALMM